MGRSSPQFNTDAFEIYYIEGVTKEMESVILTVYPDFVEDEIVMTAPATLGNDIYGKISNHVWIHHGKGAIVCYYHDDADTVSETESDLSDPVGCLCFIASLGAKITKRLVSSNGVIVTDITHVFS